MNYDQIISQKIQNIKPSGIRKFFDILEEMTDAISLGIGEPDFVTPWHIRDAGIYSLERGHTKYTSNAGMLELRREIANYLRRRFDLEYDYTNQILVTVGGSEAIDLALRVLVNPGDEVIIPVPSFVCYGPLTEMAGGVPVYVELTAENGFRLTPEQLKAAITPRTRVVMACTPNNPTGRLVDGALLRAAAEQCRAVGAVLAVDECFLPLSDGAGPGLAPCLAEHPNLLLLRAFTKSYAMAGLRLGYALSANGGLLERMAAAGPPWSVSTPAQAAGLAALEQCPDWPEKARALLASERPALSDGLAALGLEVVPGQANYLLFRAAGAADLNDRILTRGVLIRSCANYHGLGNDWYRVCVGQAEQNRRLLAALKEVL